MARYHRAVQQEKYWRRRIRVLQLVARCSEPRCVVCSEGNILLLTINHLRGGGTKEISNSLGDVDALRMWKAIVAGERGVDDLDVRCHNHNALYEYERGKKRLPENWLQIISEMNKSYA